MVYGVMRVKTSKNSLPLFTYPNVKVGMKTQKFSDLWPNGKKT